VKSLASQRVLEAKMVTLRSFRRDGAGRTLADVYVDGDDLAALLAEAVREAEAWDAGRRKGWGAGGNSS